MALPPQYQSRALPTPARVSVDPSLNPGRIIGEAIGDAGTMLKGAADRRADAEDRAERQAAALEERARKEQEQLQLTQSLAERGAVFETLQGDLDRQVLALREAGGPDHEAQIDALVEKTSGDFMATLGDQRLVNHFVTPMARLRAGVKTQATQWAIKQRGEKLGSDYDTMVSAGANNLASGQPTTADLETKITEIGATIDAMAVPQVAKDAMHAEARKRLTLGAAEAVLRSNPKALLASIDGGDFNAVLTDKELPVYRAKVEARINSLDSAARSVASADASERKQNIRVAIEDATDGVTTDPTALMQAAQWARENGDDVLAQDAEKGAAAANVNARYVALPPSDLRAAIREIEARPDWRNDRKLVASHEQLDKLADRMEVRAKSDPVGLLIEQGGGRGLPEFNFNDPAVMNRYFAIGDAAAQRYRALPRYLPEDVAAPLRTSFAAEGASGKAQLVATMAGYGRARGGGLMRQIAPAEPGYAVLLDLATMRDGAAGQRLMAEALGGWEQTKANPKLVDGAAIDLELRRQAGALAMLPGPVRQGMVEVAKGLYATRAVRSGTGSFDRNAFREALMDSMGRAGDTGGIASAPNGKPMIVPRGMSQRDVTLALSRATPEHLMSAAFGGRDAPMWGGKTMTATQFKRLTPVLVTDDNGAAVYAFQSESGFVQSQKHPGDNFMLDLRSLARRVAGRR